MFIPLTSGHVEGIVKGVIEGGANVTARALREWSDKRRRKRWIDNATNQLNQMLANPRFAFRNLNKLATAFDDDPPYTLTRETLRGLSQESVRRNVLDENTWIKENNWMWTRGENSPDRPAKDRNGLYVLRDGVQRDTYSHVSFPSSRQAPDLPSNMTLKA